MTVAEEYGQLVQATGVAAIVVIVGQMYSVVDTGTTVVTTETPLARGQLVTVGAQDEIVTTPVEKTVEVTVAPGVAMVAGATMSANSIVGS